ncbi:MAG: hypothetical protein K5888_02890 [Lachnospiraceae bacterium]|nr:hypothetical protein [Lachnospiraceae bacterium]
MEAFFPLLWVIIISTVIIRIAKKKGTLNGGGQGQSSTTGNGPIAPATVQKPHPSVSTYRNGTKPPSGGATSVYQGGVPHSTYRAERATHTLMENRESDWLAEELREEKRALYRANIMFGQQMEHRQICDAKMLKEYHLEHCSAGGIDTGQFR